MTSRQGFQTNESMVTAGQFNADGCHAYSFYNAGNVNITIDGIVVIKPEGTYEGPPMHPDVQYYSSHKIEFDEANAPTIKTPVGGVFPPSTVINPGDPAPPIDRRIVVQKVFIKPWPATK